MRWLKHAFAMDEPGPVEPTPEQQPAVDWVARQVAKRRLTTPGLITLEMSRPLNFIASQFMYATGPLVWAIARQQTQENYRHFATFLEKRGSIDYLCQRIEHFEEQFEDAERRCREAGADAGAHADGAHAPPDQDSRPS